MDSRTTLILNYLRSCNDAGVKAEEKVLEEQLPSNTTAAKNSPEQGTDKPIH